MKFRLLETHVLADQTLLSGGTLVGDDTPYPWRDPNKKPLPVTTTMEGMDDEGRKMVNDLHQRLYGRGPQWSPTRSDEARKAREKEAEEQRKLDEGSEPVSTQQKAERKFAEQTEDGERSEPAMAQVVLPRGGAVTTPPGPAREPSSTATASPTTGGTTRPSPGPATPKAPDDPRPTKPNEEQYPKG